MVLAISIFLVVYFLCCRKSKPVAESSKYSFASAASTKKSVKDPGGIIPTSLKQCILLITASVTTFYDGL